MAVLKTNKKISPEEFFIMLTNNTTDFYNTWKKGQQEQPKNYPNKLTEDEWYEQFIAWFTGS